MKRSFDKFVERIDAIGLRAKIEKRSLAHHVSLKDLYGTSERGTASVCAARRAVYGWLISTDMSINEVARLFDRSAGGVSDLINGKVELRK